MKDKFYSHILHIEPVYEKFLEIEVDHAEKEELLYLLHSHIHFTVIDVILSELSSDKKKEFLYLIVIQEDHVGAWDFVLTNISDGEERLRSVACGIVEDFVKDLEDHIE